MWCEVTEYKLPLLEQCANPTGSKDGTRVGSIWCEVTEYKMPLLEQCANPAGSKDGTRFKVSFYVVWPVGHRVQTAPTRAVCQPCGVKGRNQILSEFLCGLRSHITSCPY